MAIDPGSGPVGGILAQMCERVNASRVMHLHSKRRLIPPTSGLEHGSIDLKSGHLTSWGRSHLERLRVAPIPRKRASLSVLWEIRFSEMEIALPFRSSEN